MTKMSIQDLQIFAMAECLVLWDRIYSGKYKHKRNAARKLHTEGKLLLNDYESACPLCEYFVDCIDCPLKINGAEGCMRDTPFKAWYSSPIQERPKVAKKFFEYLLNLEF